MRSRDPVSNPSTPISMGTLCRTTAQGRQELVLQERLPSSASGRYASFFDNYDWFLEYRSVLPITCRYAAIARKILFTSLISMRTYLVRCLRDSIQPVLAACVIERRIMYLNDSFISCHDGERVPQNLNYGN